MISSQNKEIFGVFNLVGEQQANRLQGLLSPVHIVAEKEVIGLGRKSTILKETEEVVVLAVDVAWLCEREGD